MASSSKSCTQGVRQGVGDQPILSNGDKVEECTYPSSSALSDSSQPRATALTPEDLIRLADLYSSNLPARPSNLRGRKNTKDVVVITGTTGGFGCDILEHLLRDDEIAVVYAFNRKGTNAFERQRARFRQRGHDEGLLDLPKMRMIEVDLQAASFGVEFGLLEEIRNSATHIMHNAWEVNWNLELSSFEGPLLGLRNLIALSLSSPYTAPPKVMFVSSVAAFMNHKRKLSLEVVTVPEERAAPTSAIGTGYMESKWVAEEMLLKVAEQGGICTMSVRVGQVCGDKLGHWNEKEWFPAMVKSALVAHCLPGDMNEMPFVSSHPAARPFVEMRKSSSPTLHLVHPRPILWRQIIVPIAHELGVPLVQHSQWLAKLEKAAAESSAEGMRANLVLRLLPLFRAWGTVPNLPRFSTAKAELASGELVRMPVLRSEDVKRWIAAWRASGFLPTPLPAAKL